MKKNLLLPLLPTDILAEFLKFSDLPDFLALVLTCKIFKEVINAPKTANIRWQVFFSAFPYLRAEKYTDEIPIESLGTMGWGFRKYFLNFAKKLGSKGKYSQIMKMTWLEETGHLEKTLQFLGERNLKGHTITQTFRQYLPPLNFEKLIDGKQSLPKLEKEVELRHKKSLDLIFSQTIVRDFKNGFSADEKGKFIDLINMAVLSFSCYQIAEFLTFYNHYKQNKDFISSYTSAESLFIKYGVKYGAKEIVHHFLTKEKRVIVDSGLLKLILETEDVDIIKLFIDFYDFGSNSWPLYRGLINSRNPLIVSLTLNGGLSLLYDFSREDNDVLLPTLKLLKNLSCLGKEKVKQFLDILKVIASEELVVNAIGLILNYDIWDFVFGHEDMLVLFVQAGLDIEEGLKDSSDGEWVTNAKPFLNKTFIEMAAILQWPKLLGCIINHGAKKLREALYLAKNPPIPMYTPSNQAKCIERLEEALRNSASAHAMTHSTISVLNSSNGSEVNNKSSLTCLQNRI